VLNTVQDALALGFAVVLLTDAVRAVEVAPGDGAKALAAMQSGGAHCATSRELA
jgi:nicotinamidase/pyrazinamidase